MSREILGVSDDKTVLVDHKNHDTLDNRRENLRRASRLQNNRNVSKPHKHKGVYVLRGSICAHIRVKKKLVYLGSFKTIKDAALAYDKAARKYFGEFACLNYPDD